MLTFLPLEQIDEMDKWEGSELNKAKEILAFEMTNLVHGEEEAVKAQNAARALFSGAADTSNMPTVELADEDFENGEISIVRILVKAQVAKSNGEAKRLIQQGGISVNDEKVADFAMTISADKITSEDVIVKKGKKVFYKVVKA